MGETTGIAWTDHTFNPWLGCTRVSPGCENCYAEKFVTGRMGLPVWGVDAERRITSQAYWKQPSRWNKAAEKAGVRRRVFCASLADVFEIAPPRNIAANDAMHRARPALWGLIETTPNLDWLLLTKRPQNVAKLVPPDWMAGGFPHNVWLGVTAENQEHYEKRWPILANLPAQVRFISHEPALGPLEIKPASYYEYGTGTDEADGMTERLVFPDWVITGGESGPGARPYDARWARDLISTTRVSGTKVFVKQLGARPHDSIRAPFSLLDDGNRLHLKDRKGGDMGEWPAKLRVQEFPR